MEPANILRIETLPEDWRDKDSVMLHACFQLLTDFIEKEKAFDSHVNWEADEEHRQAKADLLELYGWWKTHAESDAPVDEKFELETRQLMRLIQYRWALWT